MSEPEDFLARWSRRKREAEAAPDPSEPEQPEGAAETDKPALQQTGEKAKAAPAEAAGETPTELFDISKLPSIDSITAETDIRPFLAAGVPAHLTQAALRRVWSADPKIRDFIEIAENQWDFASGAVPGFDMSPPTNVEEMVAEIFGKVRKVAEKVELPAENASSEPAAPQSSVSREPRSASEADPLESDDDETLESRVTDSAGSGDKTAQNEAAPQQDENVEADIPVLPRRHGSALPS
jgi:hypothetical protein